MGRYKLDKIRSTFFYYKSSKPYKMTMVSPDDGRPSISRTARYKKITKPLLERKRRARINRCLDELKDLMVGVFEVESENISKLEKADILELTVRHLTKLYSPRDPIADAKRFRAGFGQCAAEACQFILSMPEIDQQISQNLVKHLSAQITEAQPLSIQVPSHSNYSPLTSPEMKNTYTNLQSREYSNMAIDSSTSYLSMPLPNNHYNTNQRNSPNSHYPCDSTVNSNSGNSPTATGLLMTVNSQPKQENLYPSSNYKQQTPDEIRKRYDTEVKHVIMKRIREQILGRQTRDSECKESSSFISQERKAEQYYPDGNRYRNSHSNEDGRYSVDSRKRSKGESKHFSPQLNQSQIQHYGYHDNRNDSYDVINYSIKHQNEQKTESHPSSSNYVELDSEYEIRKRCADYRSIHPKKVLIRPLNDIDVSYKIDKPKIVTINNNDNGNSSLRQARLLNVIRNAEQSSARTFDRRNDSINMNKNFNERPINLSEYRDRNNAELSPNDEQEDNMWRPW